MLFQNGLRVAAQHAEEAGAAFDFGEQGLHLRLALVAVEVDEEDVFPDALFAWPRFDAGHVDAVAADGFEQFVEQAGAVL